MPTETTAFVFGAWFDPVTNQRVGSSAPGAVASTGEDSFISCVTIYAGGSSSTALKMSMTSYAALLIDSAVPARPTITNCFFVKNRVGIMVNGKLKDSPSTPVSHDGTFVAGNTFVWNMIGLWNGELCEHVIDDVLNGSLVNIIGTGISRIAVLNNIFDTTPPGMTSGASIQPAYCTENPTFRYSPPTPHWRLPQTWPFPNGAAVVAFEGVCQEDMSVVGFGDSNAYEQGAYPLAPLPYNGGVAVSAQVMPLPRTSIRPGTANPVVSASRNIAPFTGYHMHQGIRDPQTGIWIVSPGYVPRGVLFVRDIFCLGRYDASSTTMPAGEAFLSPHIATAARGFDGSPLDFRLAPTCAAYSPDAQFTPNLPTIPNPLVDNGFDIPLTGTFTMANGLASGAPGDWNHPHWAFDAWRTDVEGHGNDREHDFPLAEYSGTSRTDIGADELGDLVVAGYRMGTTMLVRLGPTHADNPYSNANLGGAGYALENHRVYILGPANKTPANFHPGHINAGYPQPMFRSYAFPGFTVDWPNLYTTGNQAAVGRTWHSVESTTGVYQRPWRFATLVTSNPPPSFQEMYRATAADISPHLLPDIHPWWSQYPAIPTPNSIPSSLMLWQECLTAGVYNYALYLPPTSHIANPSGSSNLSFHDPVNGWHFAWLDGFSDPGIASGPVTFHGMHYWYFGDPSGQPGFRLRSTDVWGRLFDERITGYSTVEPELPSTRIGLPGSPVDPIAIRFSLEFTSQGMLSNQRNLQSFLVLID